MKIATVVGARPQFIKAAMGSRQIRKQHREILIHTGQHFDDNMSGIFFRELGMPEPDYNLGIAGGSHAEMTARMMIGIEKILLNERPDAILVYGDTNSTLAAALTAVKLGIPVFHVEAGNRQGTLNNPEEVNRITSDHISTLLFAATETAKDNLDKENLENRATFVGNIMYDAFLMYSELKWEDARLENIYGINIEIPNDYYYLTCHREENTKDDRNLKEILTAMNALDSITIYAVHPRNREAAERLCRDNSLKNIILIKPVGYIESVHLVKNARKIVTDSGGLQCEAFFAGVQCVSVMEHAVWPETMKGNRNCLARPDSNDLSKKISLTQTVDTGYMPFGDGHAAEKILNRITEWEAGRKE